MTEKDFKRLWKNFLFDIEKNNAMVASDIGTTPQNFGKKINNGTIRFLELANIFEKYGMCSKIYFRQWQQGKSIEQLTVAG